MRVCGSERIGRSFVWSRNVTHTKRSHLRQSARTWPPSRQISCKVREESAKGKRLLILSTADAAVLLNCCELDHFVKGDSGPFAVVVTCGMTMSLPQLAYQYIRPPCSSERHGVGNGRAGTEFSPSGSLSNVLSTMYGAPFAGTQGYGAFLPYSSEVAILNQLVSLLYNVYSKIELCELELCLYFCHAR